MGSALIFAAFLFPVALYFLVLAMVNRCPGPVLVSGVWDFVGVLAAASGFLLLGGPAVLAGFNENWRPFFLLADPNAVKEVGTDALAFTVILSGGYLLVVIAGSAFILWTRRNTTVVYNVEPDVFHDRLQEVLANRKLPWTVQGRRFLLGTAVATERAPAVLEVSSAPWMRNVVLRWSGDDEAGLRQQVEGELARALAGVRTEDNPMAVWLLSLSISLFCLVFGILAIILWVLFKARG
jgi:hypothetical protein